MIRLIFVLSLLTIPCSASAQEASAQDVQNVLQAEVNEANAREINTRIAYIAQQRALIQAQTQVKDLEAKLRKCAAPDTKK
jgi:hypothetical protein